MKLLLDTHILLWALSDPDKLSSPVQEMLDDDANQLYFSVATVWEIAIKAARHKSFQVDPSFLRATLLNNGYRERKIESEHAITAAQLPPIHKDPFDRLLIAQAIVERALFMTGDRLLERYPTPVYLV